MERLVGLTQHLMTLKIITLILLRIDWSLTLIHLVSFYYPPHFFSFALLCHYIIDYTASSIYIKLFTANDLNMQNVTYTDSATRLAAQFTAKRYLVM